MLTSEFIKQIATVVGYKGLRVVDINDCFCEQDPAGKWRYVFTIFYTTADGVPEKIVVANPESGNWERFNHGGFSTIEEQQAIEIFRKLKGLHAGNPEIMKLLDPSNVLGIVWYYHDNEYSTLSLILYRILLHREI